MWFLGIIFRRVENAESVNIDLTYDIQSFTDTGKTLSSWSCGSQPWLYLPCICQPLGICYGPG